VEAIVFCSALGFVATLLLICFLIESRQTRIRNDSLAARNLEWATTQALLPKYRLKVNCVDGAVFYSDPVDPYRDIIDGSFGWEIELTSEQRARKVADALIRDGRYQCKATGTVVPVCNIKTVEIERV